MVYRSFSLRIFKDFGLDDISMTWNGHFCKEEFSTKGEGREGNPTNLQTCEIVPQTINCF